jgi:hypothetical protein
MFSDRAKRFPKTIYDKLKEETNYTCDKECTCKYLNNRTEYDRLQSLAFINNQKFDPKIFKNIKQNKF